MSSGAESWLFLAGLGNDGTRCRPVECRCPRSVGETCLSSFRLRPGAARRGDNASRHDSRGSTARSADSEICRSTNLLRCRAGSVSDVNRRSARCWAARRPARATEERRGSGLRRRRPRQAKYSQVAEIFSGLLEYSELTGCKLAHPEGFAPPTPWLVGWHSFRPKLLICRALPVK